MKHFRFILIVLGMLTISIAMYIEHNFSDFIFMLGVSAIICSISAYLIYGK